MLCPIYCVVGSDTLLWGQPLFCYFRKERYVHRLQLSRKFHLSKNFRGIWIHYHVCNIFNNQKGINNDLSNYLYSKNIQKNKKGGILR
jgi:hypothetical protein